MIRPQRTATPTNNSADKQDNNSGGGENADNHEDANGSNENKSKSKDGINSNDKNKNSEQDTENDGADTDEKEVQLYKSPRLKGYLTMFLASVINFHGVIVSQPSFNDNDGDDYNGYVVTSTDTQRMYGYTVALVSSLTSGFCVLCFLDRYSCMADTWKNNLFAPKSKFETMLDVFLVLWWFIAVIIQTRVAGIAGDGKNQYNIYFSTWCCFLCSISTLETKMTEHDWPSIRVFIQSWPHRAPGWIAILISDFIVLFWYVDVYREYSAESGSKRTPLEYYFKGIPNIQYELLMFVAAATLLPSAGFVFMEIFRDDNKKDALETLLELISLLVLACVWIPTVCIATTPGGFAMYMGNSWFFTWSTCFLVMETLLWFFSDSRGGIHQTLLQREQEYQQHQLNVLANSKDTQDEASEERRKGSSDIEKNDKDEFHHDDDDDDDDSLSIRIKDPPIKPQISVKSPAVFEMKDDSDSDENLDESIRQEIRLKETNKHAYFDTLNDILE